MTPKRCSSVHWFLGLLFVLFLATQAHAQAPITFQYFYDEVGQLVKVVDSTGTASVACALRTKRERTGMENWCAWRTLRT